jgi:hypothetical protein
MGLADWLMDVRSYDTLAVVHLFILSAYNYRDTACRLLLNPSSVSMESNVYYVANKNILYS